MKKLLTLLFAVALTLSLSSVAFAQDAGSADKKEAKKEAKAEKKTKKKAAKKEKKEDKKMDDSMKK
jgi:Ni/Co efflux regulator RcnB